ncbi:MAG: S8 family serine peptidase [Bacteroidales bacterium]
MNLKAFSFLAVFVFLTLFLFSNEIKKGERPPIDFKNIPEEAYEKGILKIKFKPFVGDFLEKTPIVTDNKGIVKFNIEGLDNLNIKYKVTNAQQHFLSPALKNTFTEKHKQWGFHLWYKLQVDKDADMIEMIKEYSKLKEVETVTPEFKKEIIGSHNNSDFEIVENKKNSDKPWTPDDPQYSNQWHYHNTGQQSGTADADIDLPEAWDLQKGNTSVIVAVVDGGIDHNHNDLSGNMWPEIGYNFVNNTSTIEPHNHGTHVAGTISASTNNSLGVAGIAGGSGSDDGVRLMSCQVFTDASSGGFHLAPVYAADNGASISQNSWGYTSPGTYDQDVLDAIDYFNTNGGGEAMSGGITIFAAGNSSSSADYYPAYYSGTMSVASTNNKDELSWYSNYGSWVDISAPGGETNSVTERGVLSTLNGNSYGYYQGTSMACPHVSGVAALILSNVYGELGSADVADILINTVDNHYDANPGYIGQLGSGRLNAHTAVVFSDQFLLMPSNPSNVTAEGVSDSEINLSWTLNEDNNNVVLAFSSTGEFGIPVEGTNYSVDDYIDGGGQVLYVGNGEAFSHSGLNAATLHYYKIWSVNEELNYSFGRNVHEYTQCGVAELPLIEDFNTAQLPYCWTLPLGEGNWRMNSSEGNPAPSAEFYWSPEQTNYDYALESPPLDGNIPGNAIALEFDLMLDNYSTNTLEEMIVQVYDGVSWVDVMSFDNSSGDLGWDTYFVDITPQALNSTFMIRFNASGENSFNINGWFIDNFIVYSFSCPQPINLAAEDITSESAVITWDAAGDEAQWDLLYGNNGFDPEHQGTLVSGLPSTSYLIEGLEVFSNYQVYVRADCGDGDVSLWSGPLNFSTLATCPAPDNLEVSQVASNSAVINWDPVGQETTWHLAYGSPGFSPDNDGTLLENLSGTEYELTGLDGMTSYEVYVRAECGSEDLSIWTGPQSFTTLCSEYLIPFTEAFDNESLDCWTFPEGQGNWGFGSSYSPPSSSSGAPNAVFSWSPSVVGYSFSLTSPLFDATYIEEAVRIDFILFLNNFDNSALEQMSVEYKLFEDSQWTLLENYNNEGIGSGDEEFIVEGLEIPGAAGNKFQIRFRAHGENSYSINGWALDDIVIHSSGVPSYTLNITYEGPGVTDPEGEMIVEHGSNQSITGSAVEGGYISDVLLDDVSVIDEIDVDGTLHLTEITSNHDVHFVFALNSYELQLSAEPSEGGTVTGAGTYEHYTEVTINAIPEDNYEFINWTLDGSEFSTEAEYTFDILSSMHLTANFELANTINDESSLTDILVYPNPAEDKLWVEFNNADSKEFFISLHSVYGQKVDEKTIKSGGFVKTSFDVDRLEPGVYIIRFSNDLQIRKVVIN